MVLRQDYVHAAEPQLRIANIEKDVLASILCAQSRDSNRGLRATMSGISQS